MEFAKGGIIPGGHVDLKMKVTRVGQCANGHCLYSFESGPAEHVVTAAEARAGDHSKIECQAELDGA